jgi:hypothetical protein
MNQPTVLEDEARQLVNRLFKSFASIFPAFKQAWPTQDILDGAKEQYVKAFLENNIRDVSLIQKGLRKARACGDVFVLAPGTFVQWCKLEPEDIGLKEVRDAFAEACYNAKNAKYEQVEWSHDVIFYAAKQIGFYEICQMGGGPALRQFEYYYAKGIDLFVNGLLDKAPEPLPKLTKQLNQTKKVAYAELDKIKEILGMNKE